MVRAPDAKAPPAQRGPGWLRRDAERLSGAMPPLLAEAERLVASVTSGMHGRRRAGPGETFWQFRAAQPGDSHQAVDWRRSARSEQMFVREVEWEQAQSVALWADASAAMNFASSPETGTKAGRAALLAMALGVLLNRGGERVSLPGTEVSQPGGGEMQLMRIANALSRERETSRDFGAPPLAGFPRGGRAVLLSDFLGSEAEIEKGVTHAAAAGVSGLCVQVLDRSEETFPFEGRVVFELMMREVRFETDRARALQSAYRDRLAQRRRMMETLTRRCGWRFFIHRTDENPLKALLWLYAMIGGGARV